MFCEELHAIVCGWRACCHPVFFDSSSSCSRFSIHELWHTISARSEFRVLDMVRHIRDVETGDTWLY